MLAQWPAEESMVDRVGSRETIAARVIAAFESAVQPEARGKIGLDTRIGSLGLSRADLAFVFEEIGAVARLAPKAFAQAQLTPQVVTMTLGDMVKIVMRYLPRPGEDVLQSPVGPSVDSAIPRKSAKEPAETERKKPVAEPIETGVIQEVKGRGSRVVRDSSRLRGTTNGCAETRLIPTQQ
jgi:hypothetical protein